ncbi:MAG: Lrp/AsnC family transcriptional regulator [Gammaproteobacteria bacterium]|nr:Lrp/AsnC family transcriptional regulator [Gammaproteobacteria bacterium]MDH5593012.1 Lrp/AsnC family transcriptional regulator [Gammaproteobacteria bacterium]MDH5614568.1 Lrp/AsnC family transcriptional regulator [Gammaproteobacteria bacterium]
MQKEFSDLERHILNDYQHNLPLTPTPYADIASETGVSEDDVINAVQKLSDEGVISRVGAVFAPNKIGVSTLAAVSVPEDRLQEVADMINKYEEVNHNYEREHAFNLWFVITAADDARLKEIIHEIECLSGTPVLNLPLVEDFHIDLGFNLKWAHAYE